MLSHLLTKSFVFVVLFVECEPGSVRSTSLYFTETATKGGGEEKQSISPSN